MTRCSQNLICLKGYQVYRGQRHEQSTQYLEMAAYIFLQTYVNEMKFLQMILF